MLQLHVRRYLIFFPARWSEICIAQLAKTSLKRSDVGQKNRGSLFQMIYAQFYLPHSSPPPLHLLILSERRLRKVSVLICQCQGSSGSQLTGVRDILEKSVSNDVFLTFLFFFFYSTDIIHKTNPIRRWHIYQFPTSAHKRPADSYVPCCLAWLILTTTTSPAWGLTDRVKWCHRPFILKIRSLWLSTGLCCSLCRLFFFFYGFCSDDPHM